MVNDVAVQEFVNAIKETPTDTNTTYSATVSKVDDEGVVWVRIHGGNKETPTASTSTEVKSGDVVTVQWRNNKLYIGGNYSNPSAGIGTVQPSIDFVSELYNKDITVNSINAATGYIEDLTSKNIKAEDISADHATIDDLDVNYAQINAANVTDLSAQNAWVNKIMVQTGLLAHEGAVFTLDAIQVNAVNITAGTIDVNRLIVTVGEGSSAQKYLVNIDPSTGTPSYEKLDGNIVEPRTITANKIVANSITTDEITVNNLVGTSGWINLHEGKFFYGDGASFASATNAISWNGSKLQIKADEFLLSSGQTIQDSIEAVENWFYAVPPTTSNEPAVNWTTDNLKEQHLRDIYFDTTSGKSYRWSKDNNVYSWVEITDVELAALANDLHNNYPPRSEFTIAPNQINAEVSKKVGNDEVIARINASIEEEGGSAVKISADKVDIAGAVIFSSSDSTLADTLTNLKSTTDGTLIYDHEYVLNSEKTIATFTAHVYRGGQDVTNLFDDSQFTWYYKTESNADPQPLNSNTSNNPQNSGKTITIELSLMKYGGEVVGKFTTSSGRKLLRTNGDSLTDVSNRSLLAQTTDTGYSVRVRDLAKATTIYPTDSLLVVQSEAEKLATIENLADAIWTKYDIRIEDEPLLQGDNYYEYLGLERLTNSEIEELIENSDLPIRPSFSNIPRYVTEEARNVSKKVLAVQNENTITSIIWADAHHTKDQVTSWQTQTNISTLHAAMGASLIAKACQIDFAAYCGDYTFGNGQTTLELFEGQCEEMNSYMDIAFYDIPSLYCVGNHDTGEYYLRDNTEGALYGAENVYRLIGSRNDDGVTVMGSTTYGYCYRDIPEKKVRVINLNTVEGETDSGYDGGQCSDTQLLWFAQTLYNVGEASDWNIFIVSHYPLDYGNTCRAGNILYQYINGGSVTYNGTTVNFSGHNLAKFIAQYHGHTHCLKVDKLHYIVNQVGTEFDAYRIATPSGTFFRNNDYAGHPVYGIDFGESVAYPKTADTAEDTAFVVNVYDPTTEVVHSFCYGAGYDRVVGIGDTTYSRVVFSLSNVTSSNTDEYVANGGSYTTTLTPNASYSMTSVTVTMGGTDITSTAYNSSTRKVNIASVSGDISITAVASKEVSYTNLVPTSTDASGAIYNGIGYKDGSRLNSSGAETTGSHMSVTGFIPYTQGQTIRLGGENIAFNEYGCMLYFYKADLTAIAGFDYNRVGNSSFGTWDTSEQGSVFALVPSASKTQNVAYIRLSASVRNASDTGSGMIVTIDERIE